MGQGAAAAGRAHDRAGEIARRGIETDRLRDERNQEHDSEPGARESRNGTRETLVSTGEKAPTVRPEDDENIPEKLFRKASRKLTTISV